MTAMQSDLSTLDEQPEHIRQATSDAKKAIEKRLKRTPADVKAEKEEQNPKTEEDYTFNFDWTDARGKRHTGSFTNKILNHLDRQVVGALQSEWQLGRPYDSFDPLTQETNYILAHMSISLKPGSDAGWAKDLRGLQSLELIQNLYQEVASHEATFHGRPTHQEGSKEGD